jgi:hypothetical protein
MVARSARRVREQPVGDGRDGVGQEPVPDAIEPDETSVRDLGGERLTDGFVTSGLSLSVAHPGPADPKVVRLCGSQRGSQVDR